MRISTIYSGGYTHARSLDSAYHPSREWIRKFAGDIGYTIPKGMRICGENLYAKHSIKYTGLKSYFYGFSVWNDENVSLSWDDTLLNFELFGITPVPTLYRGVYDESIIKGLWDSSMRDRVEGYTCRLVEAIPYNAFQLSMAKYVRENHVQTNDHWLTEALVKNEIA